MEFTASQQTDSQHSKTHPKFKIYNNKIYYMWSEYGINAAKQIWYATSNLDGTEFVEIQLTSGSKGMNEPELYIYNNIVYMSWYGETEESTISQIWIASMNLDASDFRVIYTTNYSIESRRPKIAVKNDVIYLVFEINKYDATRYKHMMLAKVNIDGSGFQDEAASSSPNEVVSSVEIFVTEDDNDNNVYYLWTRNYFIDDPPSLHLYSSNDTNLQDFTQILSIQDAYSRDLYVKDNKIYFTWTQYRNSDGMCSVVNTDGSEYKDLLINEEMTYSLLQVTKINENDIIDFAITNKTDSSFPIDTYQLLSAWYNINTEEYSETELVNDIIIGSNYYLNAQFFRKSDKIHYVWQQRDENKYHQIWTGILSLESIYDFCQWVEDKGGPEFITAFDIMQLVQAYLGMEDLGFEVTAILIMASVVYYLGYISQGNDMSGCDF